MTIEYKINEQHAAFFTLETADGETIGFISYEDNGQVSYIPEDESFEENARVYYADTKQGAINRLLKLHEEKGDN